MVSSHGHHANAGVVAVGHGDGGGGRGGGGGGVQSVRRGRDHVPHVAIGEQGAGAQGAGPQGAGPQGEGPAAVVQRLCHVGVGHQGARHALLALLVLVGHLAVPRLDALLLHGERPVDLRGWRTASMDSDSHTCIGVGG